jgi:methylmalonyl-CoA mutase C-terminal domain/subunit
MTLFTSVMNTLRDRGGGDIAVFGGGIIPDGDAAVLSEAGVKAIFTPGASTQAIVSWVKENVKPRAM